MELRQQAASQTQGEALVTVDGNGIRERLRGY